MEKEYSRVARRKRPRRPLVPNQGRYFSDEKVERIKKLLSDTDLTIAAIAERMACSRGAIATINRRFAIRLYGKKRTSWVLCEKANDRVA